VNELLELDELDDDDGELDVLRLVDDSVDDDGLLAVLSVVGELDVSEDCDEPLMLDGELVLVGDDDDGDDDD
jgi:hypothetical protein